MNITFEETFTKKSGGVLMLLCRQILQPIYSFFILFLFCINDGQKFGGLGTECFSMFEVGHTGKPLKTTEVEKENKSDEIISSELNQL